MNILVANDDGIQSQGIHELVEALAVEAGADVYVFAPDGQRSAASHAISLRGSVDMRAVDFPHARAAFALTGTPADCVAVGCHVLKEMGIQLNIVFSGINHGSNVGTDTVYSGTVGAAMEGSIQGYPSVAVSVDSHQAEHFEYACRLAVDTIIKTGGSWNSDVMININTPNIPAREIKGVKYTVIGEREYTNDIQLKEENGEVRTYVYGGEAVHYEGRPETFDVIAIQNGYASISPLHRDMTNEKAMELMDDWRIGK
ncbi:MAG: 5'/3'-nucleotidase SurE [Lentihominibacter sp.]